MDNVWIQGQLPATQKNPVKLIADTYLSSRSEMFSQEIKKQAAFFQVFLCACAAAFGQIPDLESVIKALSQDQQGSLVGLKVTAWETNVVVPLHDSIEASGVQTNTSRYLYRFGDRVTSIARRVFDQSGKLLREQSTLLSKDDDIWDYSYDHVLGAEPGVNARLGSIERRGKRVLTGIPAFFSKSTLRDFIVKSPQVSIKGGKSTSSQDCVIVDIVDRGNAAIPLYRLFLTPNALVPVEFNSYLSNGSVYSSTQLHFEETGLASFVCKRADATIISEGSFTIKSVWTSVSAERESSLLVENLEGFFPPETGVSDRRFQKTLNYHMGRRLPDSNEIHLMLTMPDGKGIARYEAATSGSGVIRHSTMPSHADTHGHGSRMGILTILAAVSIAPLVFFGVVRMRSKQTA